MLPPIHLNNQLVLQTYKIEDIIAKWMLPSKFEVRYLPAA